MKTLGILKASGSLAVALAVSACGSMVPYSNGGSQAGRSSDTSAERAPAPRRVATAPQSYSSRTDDRECLASLQQTGAEFTPLPDSYDAPGCSKLGTVQLSALYGDAARFGVSNIGAVQCKTASTFNAWARFGVDRAARQILGSSLARIETMGSYSCRNIAGSNRRSAHATADAIDVSAFILEDGRRVSLKSAWDNGTSAERKFLRVVHQSACRRFGTVLGPDYNRAHEDHFHLEGSGSKFCR